MSICGVYIKCIVFKPSGKYYTDEYVYYSDSIMADYQVPDEIRRNRDYKSMYNMGMTPENKVPFLIKPEADYE